MGCCCTSGHHEFIDANDEDEHTSASPKNATSTTPPSGALTVVGVPAQDELQMRTHQSQSVERGQPLLPHHGHNNGHSNGMGGTAMDQKRSLSLINSNQSTESIESTENVAVRKHRARHERRDSGLDPETLLKFESHQKKMRERESKKKPVIIKINIKSMDSNYPIFAVEMDQNHTVAALKKKIEKHSPDNVDPQRQRLIHRGRLLSHDGRRLKQCNIRDTDSIILVRSRRKQTVFSNSEANQRGGIRARAMTLGGAPEAHHQTQQRRSKTPDPSQSAQVY